MKKRAQFTLTPERKAYYWSHVEKSQDPEGCWLWTAAKNAEGIGYFRVGDKMVRGAHQVGWYLAHGTYPRVITR